MAKRKILMRCPQCKEMKRLTTSGYCLECRDALIAKHGRLPKADAMNRRVPGSFGSGRR
jgi:hypothetical protein